MNTLLRQLPSIDSIHKDERFMSLFQSFPITDSECTELIKSEVTKLREKLLNDEWYGNFTRDIAIKHIFEGVHQQLERHREYQLQKLINATGVILHTNLGRARLSKEAIKQVVEVAENYSNLEYNIESGKRGSRHTIIEELLCNVTGAEAAMVVNNNAAAVYLILSCFARAKEVIVSRGELVEIGGSFRVSSIMEESGAILKEVGTTNKTKLEDYKQAISDNTAMLMKVHTSNFKVIGFTESVPSQKLITLKNDEAPVIVYEDLGSGSLFDFQSNNIGEEPVVSKAIQAGVDIVSFSGDKLLGGPQAGIIVGRSELISRLKKHQLARVLRIDKLTLAALEGTIKSYIKQTAIEDIPTIRDILKTKEDIKTKANLFISQCSKLPHRFSFSLEQDFSKIGGGTMPDVKLPTYVVKCIHQEIKTEMIEERLRLRKIPIIVRVKDNHVLLDFRTISEAEINHLVTAFMELEKGTEAR